MVVLVNCKDLNGSSNVKGKVLTQDIMVHISYMVEKVRNVCCFDEQTN